MDNNKNTLYVVIALLIGLILGYLISNSGITNSKQAGQAISSDNDLNKNSESNKSPAAKEVISYLAERGITAYSVNGNSPESIKMLAENMGLPYYSSIREFLTLPPGSNERPVTCMYFEFGQYISGYSEPGGSVGVSGNYSSMMVCYYSY